MCFFESIYLFTKLCIYRHWKETSVVCCKSVIWLFLFVVMSDAGSLVLVAVSGQDVRNGRHYKTINRWSQQLGGNKLVISEKMRWLWTLPPAAAIQTFVISSGLYASSILDTLIFISKSLKSSCNKYKYLLFLVLNILHLYLNIYFFYADYLIINENIYWITKLQ